MPLAPLNSVIKGEVLWKPMTNCRVNQRLIQETIEHMCKYLRYRFEDFEIYMDDDANTITLTYVGKC